MIERPHFITDEIYHIFNRGVEKRTIFMNQGDYFRFIHDLFEFNDKAPAFDVRHHVSKESELPHKRRKPRDLLVEILCFCAMPNHYHLLLRQKIEGGITEFMRKFGTGYTNYFNKKYERVGHLLQGKFKAVHVAKESHLLYLPHYIHLNPLDLIMPEWRDQKVKDPNEAIRFLASYRWSSYMDYIGLPNFPSVTQRNFLHEMYGSPTSRDYLEMMKNWIEDIKFEFLQGVTLE